MQGSPTESAGIYAPLILAVCMSEILLTTSSRFWLLFSLAVGLLSVTGMVYGLTRLDGIRPGRTSIASRLMHTAKWVLILVALAFIMVNIHEIGHTVTARIGGDRSASYHLYQSYPNGQIDCLGCNTYNPAHLRYWGKFWNAIGGVMATQCAAILALLVARYVAKRRVTRQILGLFMIICIVGDALDQMIQALFAPIGAQSGLTNVDFADALYLLHSRFGYPIAALKVCMGAVTLLYVCIMLRKVSSSMQPRAADACRSDARRTRKQAT